MAYGIPPDNPFSNGSYSKPEIYALGLRNPWRTGMDAGDRKTGSLPLLCSLSLSLWLIVPVNSYGHVETVISDFVGLSSDIRMMDTSSPVIKHDPNKQLRLICRGGLTYHLVLAF